MQFFLPLDESGWVPVRDGMRGLREFFAPHYSARTKKGEKVPRGARRKIVGPGRYLVLVRYDWTALLAVRESNREIAGYRGLYLPIFRRLESCPIRASDPLRSAEKWIREKFPEHDRIFTFVNAKKVRSEIPGYCFRRAGWKCADVVGRRKLLIFTKRLRPDREKRKGTDDALALSGLEVGFRNGPLFDEI